MITRYTKRFKTAIAAVLTISVLCGGGIQARASDTSTDIQPEKTIAAQWKANAVKITFNSNGGGVAPGEQVYTYGVERSLPNVCSMSKTGYSFIGWAESSTATTPTWEPGATTDCSART